MSSTPPRKSTPTIRRRFPRPASTRPCCPSSRRHRRRRGRASTSRSSTSPSSPRPSRPSPSSATSRSTSRIPTSASSRTSSASTSTLRAVPCRSTAGRNKRNPRPDAGGFHFLRIGSGDYSPACLAASSIIFSLAVMKTSTRRFCARPASVELSATGWS